MPPMRTLPYEVVMECKRELTRKPSAEIKRYGLGPNKLARCALDLFTERYGGATGVVRDRVIDTARKVAGGYNAAQMAKRLRKSKALGMHRRKR
jgi:hypothetical protein